MALFARRVVVGAQDAVDHRLERIDNRGHGLALILLGLWLSQNLADFAPRMMKAAGQLADAHLVLAMRLANAGIFVHLDHPPPPAAGSSWGTSLQEITEAGSARRLPAGLPTDPYVPN